MKEKFLIISIIILAVILRFNQLESLPALNADEAAIGYNAYSLLQTGHDEHGNSWPISFQSFNDWKPGLYFYITMPFVKLLGLNILAVRIPGATAGVLTVLIVWLIIKELFPDKKYFASLSAFFLAISPWHLQFSRGAWEASTALFFIACGLLFFLKGLKNNKWWVFSVSFFLASLYTYHAARVVVPLLALAIIVFYHKAIFPLKMLSVGILLSAIILLIPLFLSLKSSATLSRAEGVGIFADTGPYWRANKERGEHDNHNSFFAKLFHNKPVNYTLDFLQNYTSHFNGEFLFLSGDSIERDKVPEMGEMYLFDIIFFGIGLFAVFKKLENFGLILFWLLVAPIPAALTFQSPHALRAENMVIPTTIISAFGVWSLFNWLKINLKQKVIFLALYSLLFILILWDFSRYLHQYYVYMAKTYDFSSQYGLKELVNYVSINQNKYRNIVVTTRYDQPYILFLFYMGYPPSKFQKEHKLTPKDQFGFSTVRKFDKYHFLPIGSWDKIKADYPNSLITGTSEEIPDGTNVIKTIYFPSGDVAFKIVAN